MTSDKSTKNQLDSDFNNAYIYPAMTEITIYTDGSAKGNPGKGGYAAVLISGNFKKEISQGFQLTTNNRMELLAVIVALELIKQSPAKVKIYSDSKYVVDAVEKNWLFDWEKKGFLKKKNVDLWRRFLKVYRKHVVNFEWLKGHAGNEWNERCDQLAVKAAEGENLLMDEGYQNQSEETLF